MRSYGYLTGVSVDHLDRYVEVRETQLFGLIRMLLATAEVDEDWYRTTYKDVDEAIKQGSFADGHAHFVRAGYFENRLPRPVVVDEDWYLQTYQDVAAAIRRAHVASASWHFHHIGFAEGRLPSSGWSVLRDK